MKFFTRLIILVFLTATPALASNYNYISQEELKNSLITSKDMTIVDIQVEEEYAAHHIPGSLATYAYPVKTATDRAKLDTIVATQQGAAQPLVIVCPRGGGGAKRTYDYFKQKGISEENLVILEKGMNGWPYKEFTIAGK